VDKPPGWTEQYADTWELDSAADHYALRPAYPDATFDVLTGLVDPAVPRVLDAGCGLGNLARPLARRVAHVDAVDRSPAMVSRGRAMDGGDSANLRWLVSRVETADVDPPYGLVVCGDSIHWFDWEVALPAFGRWLTPDGHLAICQRSWLHDPVLTERLGEVYGRMGINHKYEDLRPATVLEERGLFRKVGSRDIAAVPWRPTLAELVGLHHSQSAFPIDRMPDPDAFDREVSDVVRRTIEPGPDGRYELTVDATVVWGRPGATAGADPPQIDPRAFRSEPPRT
jgi:SAM-dependent methyltransferase